MRTFILIWSGQLVSLLGSSLTSFALGVWVYQRTGSATKFALIALFSTLPGVIASPFAGAIADRWDRRRMLIACDLGAGFCTLIIAALLYAGSLEVWHIYIINAVKSLFSIAQGPAFAAATSLLVPKRHLGRASGMVQLSEAVGQIAAPILAVILIAAIHLWGIIFVDFATFLFAALVLLSTRIPRVPAVSTEGLEQQKSLLRDVAYGWSYITTRPGLFGLLVFFALSNFLMGFIFVLSAPLVLSFASAAVLGKILSIGGCGFLAGSLVMSFWGGPRRRVYGVLGFYLLAGFCIILMGIRPSAILIGAASFCLSFSLPIIIGSSQAIWQSKVALEVQGRVFAVRRMIAWSSAPLAYLVAGPLADKVFEPLLAPDGALAASVGQIIGVGRGRGIGLLYFVLGVCMVLAVAVAYLYPRLRYVEDELSDVIGDEAFVRS
jgi:MFS transporter, DHA3 family, macrolide efflux protein